MTATLATACSGGSVISVHRADSGPISSPGAPWVPIVTAGNVPAGNYTVVAKTTIFDPETDGGDCQLVSNTGSGDVATDSVSQSPYKGASATAASTFNLEALVALPSPGKLVIQCRRGGPILRSWRARDSKIIAIAASSVTDAEVRG